MYCSNKPLETISIKFYRGQQHLQEWNWNHGGRDEAQKTHAPVQTKVVEYCSRDQFPVHLRPSIRQTLTEAGEKRESRGKYTAHEHVGRKGTRRKHEVSVNDVVEGALEDGKETKTNAGSADAETSETESVSLCMGVGHGTYPIQ